MEARATWRAITEGRSEDDDDDDCCLEADEEEDDEDGGAVAAKATASSATSENSLSLGPRTRTLECVWAGS